MTAWLRSAVGIVVLVVLVFVGFQGWMWWRDRQVARRTAAEVAVATAEAAVRAAQAERDSARADAARARAGGRAVLTSPRVPSAGPRPTTPDSTALDTLPRDSLIAHIDTLNRFIDTLVARVDTLQRRDSSHRVTIADLVTSSTRDSSAAATTEAGLRRQIVAMQVVIDTPKPRDPLGLGACAGYVVAFQDGRTGPGLCVGATFSIGLPRLPWRRRARPPPDPATDGPLSFPIRTPR